MRPLLTKKHLMWRVLKPGQTIVGGEVETKNNVLTGVLIDNATDLVYGSIPAVTKQTYTQVVASGAAKLFCAGAYYHYRLWPQYE